MATLPLVSCPLHHEQCLLSSGGKEEGVGREGPNFENTVEKLNSVVGTVTRQHVGRPRDRGSILGRGKAVNSSPKRPRPPWDPSYFPFTKQRGIPPPGLQPAALAADPSPQSSEEAKNKWRCTFTPPYAFMTCTRTSLRISKCPLTDFKQAPKKHCGIKKPKRINSVQILPKVTAMLLQAYCSVQILAKPTAMLLQCSNTSQDAVLLQAYCSVQILAKHNAMNHRQNPSTSNRYSICQNVSCHYWTSAGCRAQKVLNFGF
jgi:hypothetical protein